MPTIRDLILERRDRTGESFRQMAAHAEEHGLFVKHQTIAELAKDAPRQWPKNSETISALAVALGVTERTVVLAFARSFGLDVGPARDVFEAAMPSDLSRLPRDAQLELIDLVQSFIQLYLKAGGGDVAAAPMNDRPPLRSVAREVEDERE